jgi:hypothetical protein
MSVSSAGDTTTDLAVTAGAALPLVLAGSVPDGRVGGGGAGAAAGAADVEGAGVDEPVPAAGVSATGADGGAGSGCGSGFAGTTVDGTVAAGVSVERGLRSRTTNQNTAAAAMMSAPTPSPRRLTRGGAAALDAIGAGDGGLGAWATGGSGLARRSVAC